MQLQVEIGFDQLVQLAKRLPESLWTKLKQEVEEQNTTPNTPVSDLEAFLLTAPTFSQKQVDEITKTRKAINQWRKE